MKHQTLHLQGGVSIETARDFNGRFWIAYLNGCSMFFREAVDLKKWLQLGKGTARYDSFDSWISSLADFDKEKGAAQDPSALPRAESSFDPLAHGIDAKDPNFQTRQII
jgi:hypothetical protein